MAKYSSDSDSDRSSRHRRKHYRRSRSSSSDSSDSSPYRKRSSKHSKSKRRHRSRSRSRERDRSSRTYKSVRTSSRDRDRRRYRSRRSRSYSPDHSKKRTRSVSREKSTSRSSSSQSNVKTSDKGQIVLNKGPDDFSIEPRIKESVLDEINSDSFAPKHFSSSTQDKHNKLNNIVIDINADTIKIPVVTKISGLSDSIFHTSIIVDQDIRFDKWVKKLYTLRQKAILDSTHVTIT
ncbi:serine/threonine-protein kinase fray2 [Cephus cinctus]|uniref:Serine/threonine-protein kinase fray2 n=1 Tax=Cephus cinctus TaxID=211228 RepID=A0AAJ7CEG8_CEPCN|nr:serine/threonine-protein kinase fray2 [Cephus cinctus]